MMLISKYGFSDILVDGITRYDPSRVASQIVSGIGFLGAGIILTRHGAIRGLTTAATIWETAAIGMACGAGLWWLATAGTVLHFIVIALLTPPRSVHPHAHPWPQGDAHYPLHAGARRPLHTPQPGISPRLDRLRSVDPHGFK